MKAFPFHGVFKIAHFNDTPCTNQKMNNGLSASRRQGSGRVSTWPSQTCGVCAINNGPKCTNKNQISRISFAVQTNLPITISRYSSISTSEWLALNNSARAFSSIVCEMMQNILISNQQKKITSHIRIETLMWQIFRPLKGKVRPITDPEGPEGE
jgi:hypothetical protein